MKGEEGERGRGGGGGGELQKRRGEIGLSVQYRYM